MLLIHVLTLPSVMLIKHHKKKTQNKTSAYEVGMFVHKADYAKLIRLCIDLLPLVTIILIGLKRKIFHLR